ncbi:MAG: low molecular weight phosphotyrosine protein phosphatase [Bacteroidetes bacterium]|nr:low molecular weight phosphotyrosine protein phosphatase [Bacteroidota bacterium]MDA0859849.1 low molecular weight phosphotyrosine protein phosphatase [Bacteroidota bacterium]MDA1317565.1 low molecular weight phosphotyrosine protein phosphatase [Bacteroidota bacterium]
MTKILMVCLGNICRSPLAEGIMRSKLSSTHFFIDSAGTSGFHSGNAPDPRSIEVAQKNGLDISQQKSRPFRAYDLEEFDVIFVMDKANYRDVIRHVQNEDERQKVKLILNYPNSETEEVPDPYYGGKNGFDHVYNLLEKACTFHSNQLISEQ